MRFGDFTSEAATCRIGKQSAEARVLNSRFWSPFRGYGLEPVRLHPIRPLVCGPFSARWERKAVIRSMPDARRLGSWLVVAITCAQ